MAAKVATGGGPALPSLAGSSRLAERLDSRRQSFASAPALLFLCRKVSLVECNASSCPSVETRCPARHNAVGWWRDLTAEGIEPNPGPWRRLPAGGRRASLWCLNVGSAVAAWETLEDAATERVEMVALQQVKLSIVQMLRHTRRRPRLRLFRCTCVKQSEGLKGAGRSCRFGQQALQIQTGGEVLELWRSGKPGLGEWQPLWQLLRGT